MSDDGTTLGHWVNRKAEVEYLDLYAELREEAWDALCEQGWSAHPDELEVKTRFGSTHVFHWPGAGVPLVFLHGAGTSSIMWAPLIAGLTGCSTFAIDGIGEPGLSIQTTAVRDAGDLVAWLDETFDGLDLDLAHLVGASYGGWIALHAALSSPERVATLTLLEPVLTRLRPYFWAHGLSVGVAFALPTSLRRPALRRLHMEAAAELDARFSRFGRLGLMKHRRAVPKPAPLTDAELGSVRTPTLVLLADKSEIHKSSALATRVRATMPNVDCELVANAGHSLPLDRAEIIAPRLRSFIATRHDTTSP